MSSVLLVTIDTLRADHLECYGYPRRTGPNLDRLAREGIRFEWALAPISYTVPSLTSTLTGVLPSFHSAGFSNMPRRELGPETPPLAKIAADQGIETGAFVSTIVLDRKNCGLAHGFGVYDDLAETPELNRPKFLFRRAEETVGRAVEWLRDRTGKPFFLWVHLMDVHGPYTPPEPFAHRFTGDGLVETEHEERFLEVIRDPVMTGIAPTDFSPGLPRYQALSDSGGPAREDDYVKHFRFYRDRYDGAIAYTDLWLGRLLAWLRKLGREDETTVVIHSDHGEAMGEGEVFFFHGLTVTPDQVRVPLIIRSPKLNPGVAREPVSLCDLAGFMAECLGLAPDLPGYEEGFGNLARPSAERTVISQVGRQLALARADEFHLYGPGWFRPELAGRMFGAGNGEDFLKRSGSTARFSLRETGPVPLNRPETPSAPEFDQAAVRFIREASGTSSSGRPISANEDEKKALEEKMAELGYL